LRHDAEQLALRDNHHRVFLATTMGLRFEDHSAGGHAGGDRWHIEVSGPLALASDVVDSEGANEVSATKRRKHVN